MGCCCDSTGVTCNPGSVPHRSCEVPAALLCSGDSGGTTGLTPMANPFSASLSYAKGGVGYIKLNVQWQRYGYGPEINYGDGWVSSPFDLWWLNNLTLQFAAKLRTIAVYACNVLTLYVPKQSATDAASGASLAVGCDGIVTDASDYLGQSGGCIDGLAVPPYPWDGPTWRTFGGAPTTGLAIQRQYTFTPGSQDYCASSAGSFAVTNSCTPFYQEIHLADASDDFDSALVSGAS